MGYIESGRYQSSAKGNTAVVNQYGLTIDSVGYYVAAIDRQVFWSEYEDDRRLFLPQLTKNQNLAVTEYRQKNNLAGTLPFIIAYNAELGVVEELAQYKTNSIINQWDRSISLDDYIRSVFGEHLYQYYIPHQLTRPVEYGRMAKLPTRGRRGRKK